jgi:multiple sugar transport system permease protein
MEHKHVAGRSAPSRRPWWQARGLRATEERDFVLLLIPELLGLLLLFIGPLVAVVAISLLKWDGLTKATWEGLGNYRALFDDSLFWQSVYNTAYYTVLTVGLGTIVAFGVALLWNQPIRGITFYRTLYYLPVIVPAVAGSVVWGMLLNPSFGLLNVILNWFGLPGFQWLQDPSTAKPAIVLLGLWTIGNAAVIYLAGLKGIPGVLYEAARIDGAGSVRQLFQITVPMMAPTLMFNIIMSIVASAQVFTPAYVLTGGGPINSTLFYVLYLYQNAFQNFQMGYASAQAVLLLVVTFALSLIIVRFFQNRMFYD